MKKKVLLIIAGVILSLGLVIVGCGALVINSIFDYGFNRMVVTEKLDKDELWLNNILKMHKIKRTKDVLLCILDEYDGVLIQKKR